MKKLLVTLAMVLCLPLVTPLLAPLAKSATAADPEEITFALVQDERMTVLSKRWESTLEYLSRKIGKKINFYATTSYASVVEAMMGGFVDVAKLGPKIYLVAAEKSKKSIVPIVNFARAPDRITDHPCGCYYGVLITKKGSGLTSIASLKGRVLALVDPGSTSGNAVPRALFPGEIGGATLEEYFGKIFYSGSHDASAVAVAEGRADAAFVASSNLSNTIVRGLVKKGDFNFLWRSPQIPIDNISVNTRTLSQGLIKRIQETFLAMHQDEEGTAALKELFADRFLVATDKTYDPLRRILEAKKKSK
ncbi:MAG: phosphate/phosphite/phosphonate ABC transporter substrate-binding protein, partial [Candidatus Bipolaricaulia bacterium]